VVIGDLDLVGVVVFPDKNDPPLLVDPDAVKIAQVAGQLLKAVARRNPQGLNFTGQFPGWCEVENLRGFCVGEAFDHAREITKKENHSKRKS
jgi:hypothetical protein